MSTIDNRPKSTAKSRKRSKPNGKDVATVSTSDAISDDEIGVPYEEQERRNTAARILANDEMLMWASHKRHDSMLQTRIYFQAKAAGIRDEDLRFDYKTDLSEERDTRDAAKGKSPAAKGTARVVSGSSSSRNMGSPATASSSSKTAGSPANNRKDKDKGGARRKSNGTAR